MGTEAQILTPEIYANVDQTKFIPVVFERNTDKTAALPVYLKSRIYIDATSSNPKGIEELARHILGRPLHSKPPLGTPPSFDDASPDTLDAGFVSGLSAESRRIVQERPEGYEFLFLFQQLDEAIRAHSHMRSRAQHGIVHNVQPITAEDFSSYTRPALSQLKAVAKSGNGLINGMLKEALAEPGIPADLEGIAAVAQEYGELYQRLLEYKLTARSFESDDENLESALDSFAQFADTMISEFETFPERARSVFTGALASIVEESEPFDRPPRVLSIGFDLSIPEHLNEIFSTHIEAAIRSLS